MTAGAPLTTSASLAVEQYGAGPVGDDAARRPRRRGDQDRGPDRRRRRRPLRAAVPGGRELALLRDLQPQQAQHLARPAPSGGAAGVRGPRALRATRSSRTCAATSPRSSACASRISSPSTRTIVCCSLSGFGIDGPRAGEGAYDYTLQGLAGWQSITGEPDGPPTKSGLSLVDFCGGYVAALAILAGVWRARRDGRGSDIDLSLFEVALAQLTYIGTWVASRGYEPVRRGELGPPVDGAVPELRDGRRLDRRRLPEAGALGALCAARSAAGAAAEDARFDRFAGATRTATELVRGALDATFARPPTRTGSSALRPPACRARPVNDVAAALADARPSRAGGRRDTSTPCSAPSRRSRARCASTASASRRGAARCSARTRTRCCASSAAIPRSRARRAAGARASSATLAARARGAR